MQDLFNKLNDLAKAVSTAEARARAKLVWSAILSIVGLTTPGLWPLLNGLAYTSSNEQTAHSFIDGQSMQPLQSWGADVETEWYNETEVSSG